MNVPVPARIARRAGATLAPTLPLTLAGLLLAGCATPEHVEDMNRKLLAERDCRGEVHTTHSVTVSSEGNPAPVTPSVRNDCVPPERDTQSDFEKNRDAEAREQMRKR